jgi:hypothetical protein
MTDDMTIRPLVIRSHLHSRVFIGLVLGFALEATNKYILPDKGLASDQPCQ